VSISVSFQTKYQHIRINISANQHSAQHERTCDSSIEQCAGTNKQQTN